MGFLISSLPVAVEVLVAVAVAVVVLLVAMRLPPKRTRGKPFRPDETGFPDPKHPESEIPFPSVFDDATLYLTAVVPAYNEEKRLPIMLDQTLAYFTERGTRERSFTWEIIVVDDGSRDGTSAVVQKYAARVGSDRLRLLRLRVNRGKGGAVRRGMMYARGRHILMVDADGATQISDLQALEAAIGVSERQLADDKRMAIAVGSRAHKAEEAVAERAWYRTVLMYGFHFAVLFAGVRKIKDTQCGFKLFSRQAARVLFPPLHIERWAFDVEMLIIAQALGMAVAEVPVNWHEVDGSKLDLARDTIQMGKDMVRIRLLFLLRLWTVDLDPRLVASPALL